MPRSARIVIPQLAHHVIQRGNRRQAIFFSDDDRQAYLDLLAINCRKPATRCLAWCLMDSHVHLVLLRIIRSLPDWHCGQRTGAGQALRPISAMPQTGLPISTPWASMSQTGGQCSPMGSKRAIRSSRRSVRGCRWAKMIGERRWQTSSRGRWCRISADPKARAPQGQ